MGRGPSYPYVGLEEAIGLTQKMYDYTKRAAAPVDSIITDAWSYSPTSSSGIKVLAALKAYGLVEDGAAASGKASLKLTPRSIRILLDEPDSPARRDEIRKAALSPKWYDYCWKTWGKEMAASMKSNLLIEHGFVDSTVDGFLKDYRKTIGFAGLLDDVIFSNDVANDEKSGDAPKIGEYVQWESKGDLKMAEARKLVRIEDDPHHGKFGFVEGYPTGMPYEELHTVAAPPANEPKHRLFSAANLFTPPVASSLSRGETKMETESFALSNGLTAQFQWPNVMSEADFKRFEYFVEGVKMSIKEAVRTSSGAEPKLQDEKATQEGMEGPG